MLKLLKKYWWVLLLVLLATVAVWLLMRNAKKTASDQEIKQRRIDSLTVRVHMLDSLSAVRTVRIQALEANERNLTEALKYISTQRKNERHAYHKNLDAVRALPDGRQVEYLSGWLPAKTKPDVR